MGPITHIGLTETLQRETENLQYHLSETEKIRVSGSGYVNWTRWRRIEIIGGAELDILCGTYVDMRK